MVLSECGNEEHRQIWRVVIAHDPKSTALAATRSSHAELTEATSALQNVAVLWSFCNYAHYLLP